MRILQDNTDYRYHSSNPDRMCSHPGCDRKGQHMGKYRADGSALRRATCSKHHSIRYGIGDWAYKRYRKSHCENTDGRLGYVCEATIVWEGQLQVDHIDGNHDNNDPDNLQTLCANCHSYKTFVNSDWMDKRACSITVNATDSG